MLLTPALLPIITVFDTTQEQLAHIAFLPITTLSEEFPAIPCAVLLPIRTLLQPEVIAQPVFIPRPKFSQPVVRPHNALAPIAVL